MDVISISNIGNIGDVVKEHEDKYSIFMCTNNNNNGPNKPFDTVQYVIIGFTKESKPNFTLGEEDSVVLEYIINPNSGLSKLAKTNLKNLITGQIKNDVKKMENYPNNILIRPNNDGSYLIQTGYFKTGEFMNEHPI
jgi:hypothetical protein